MKVLWLCLLLTDISASMKILDNISVIISTKKYDTDTSLNFHLIQAFGTTIGLENFITKYSLFKMVMCIPLICIRATDD